ncbi:response regulator transcription factor [Coraliomargarita algicola]|uniref:Response regulator transcription factor n=1 Tax=Coraliomargarita algicola TaxID=3092156 RepID=A0ABZ0RHM5_9BACT|nr:response regulator transcription factor [Coraliomargarita sp. J2-16]WPJ95699.1 response regulator transcription factor [Coraliomargarita sp. J2-16]
MATPPSDSSPINVCIIEDHSDFRNTLRAAINAAPSLQCNAAFSNAEDAFEYLNESGAPDIIVLDLGLPGMDGIEAIPKLRELAPETKVLILTVFENKTRVLQALGAGASGYLMKASGIKSIIQGIEDAHNGIAPLSAEIAQMVFATFRAFKPVSHEAEISDREVEVLQKLADGATRIEVADQLHVSRHTIDSHIRNIYRKLQVHNVSGAITKAAAMHII